jgi:hypothetical protein
MAEAKTLFSPEVIWAAAKLSDPSRTSGTGWKIGSRSEPGTWRHVHTDATVEANSLGYANCSCPAGVKGARINQKIVPCGHVFRVLMAIANGLGGDEPLDPAEEAVAVELDSWLGRQADDGFATMLEAYAPGENQVGLGWIPMIDQAARTLVAAAREATKKAKAAQNAASTS